MKVKNLQKRGNAYSFRLVIPKDLQQLYRRTEITKSVGSDYLEAIKQVENLTVFYKKEFDLIRKDSTKGKAIRLLRSYDLDPVYCPPVDTDDGYTITNPDHQRLLDDLQDANTIDYDDNYQPIYKPSNDYEDLALNILNGKVPHTIDDVLEYRLQQQDVTGRKKINEVKLSFRLFSEVIGKSLLKSIRAKDAYDFQQTLTTSFKNATVNKRISILRKAIGDYMRTNDLKSNNPFNGLKKLNTRLDAQPRKTFKPSDMLNIKVSLNYINASEIVVGLLYDTGCRVNEIAGLLLSDIKIDNEIPHLVITANEYRQTKHENSERLVPLVGVSLEAAKILLNSKQPNQVKAFPNYFKDNKLTDNAAANVRKWLKTRADGTAHSFRHTMTDRLKEANVQESTIENIMGWTSSKMVNHYGKYEGLRQMQKALEAASNTREW